MSQAQKQQQAKRLKTTSAAVRMDSSAATSTTTTTPGTSQDREEADSDKSRRDQLTQEWMPQLDIWFPDLLKKTYFVPPVHVNKTDLTDEQQQMLPSSSLLHQAQGPTKESDFRGDAAQLTVERALWRLARKEGDKVVMVVLSNFNLDNYLNKTLSGAPVRKKRRRRKDRKTEDPQARESFPFPPASEARGEFDLLLVLKDYGFLIIEIKAVGDIQQGSLEDALQKELSQALRQLNKRQGQLDTIASDLGGQGARIPVTKIGAFPHVTREKLTEVMTSPGFSSNMCDELNQYLGTDTDLENVLKLWLCKDEIDGAVTSEGERDDVIVTWFQEMLRKMESTRPADFRGIDDDVYKQLIARLCGPMTTVEVWRRGKPDPEIHEARDLADAAHVMRTWCQLWILRPQQLHWYHRQDPFVYLTGPPGSGKTLLLVLKAVERVQQDDTTVVVVRGPGNLPGHLISQLFHSQIVAALHDTPHLTQRVLMETIDARTDPEDFVSGIKQKAAGLEGGGGTKVMFLVDELWLANPSGKMLGLLREMVKMLETCKKEAEEERKDAGSVGEMSALPAASAATASAAAAAATAESGTVQEQEATLVRVLEALSSIEQTVKDLHNVHDIAKAILTDSIAKEEEKLLSLVEEMRAVLVGKDPRVLAAVLERALDVQFYAKVLTSWMASPVLHEIMQEARRQGDGVSLWCTGFWPNRCPQDYLSAQFSDSIRCPCHIQDLLEQTELLASHQDQKQYDYLTTSTRVNPPLPAEAAPSAMLTKIDHGRHVTPGGGGGGGGGAACVCVSRCAECGEELATLLLDSLRVDRPGSHLHFRDVLIVGRSLLPIKPDSAFVRALRARGIPASVVVDGSDDLDEDGLFANSVLITNTYNGHGLERTVVVFVPDIKHCGGDGDGDGDGGYIMENLGEFNRMGVWFIASRSLGHFVLFHV
ncbi:uncharacterized protein LOC143298141 isoform X2 [Babylonia areolata]|uniref:uncharacterized protein LOC143298141 isoform X2 n=1 Tax=Babylonia areolata TaxID=304850 RepID=UPI003FD3E113